MKKVYTKPVLVLENFSLSQSICHNCSTQLDFTQAEMKDKYSCGWNTKMDGDLDGKPDVIFTQNTSNCTTKVEDDGFSGYCYNNPNGGLVVFNS